MSGSLAVLNGIAAPLIVLGVLAALIALRALNGRRKVDWRMDVAAVLVLMVTAGGLEVLMGRPLTYQHGPVALWSGDISSDQNSQQIADPYTFTHVTHGVLFYALTRAAFPAATPALRMLVSAGAEGAWEAYENTSTVIERYRSVTISLGYYGDSVLNSMCDVLACLLGFWLTSRLPTRVTIAWVVAVELLLAFWIRDNLTLNILMLVYPLDVVRRWQAGL